VPANQLTDLDHLLAVFGAHRRVEQLEDELRVAASHRSELADYLRSQLAAGAYDAPHRLITRAGAEPVATIHDASAADRTAMADAVPHALDSNRKEQQ
jgi:hypothetical protein